MIWLLPRVAALRLCPSSLRHQSCSIHRSLSSGPAVIRDLATILRGSADGTVVSEPRHLSLVGHVRTVRNQKRRSFVEIGDGSTLSGVQALLTPEQAAGLQTGTAVKLSGTWEPSPPGKEQSHELHVLAVEVLGQGDAESYPIQKKYQTPEFLRKIPHLRLRVPFNALLARLRSECDYHVASFFRNSSFVQVHPPLITSSDCEGGGEVFTVVPKGTDEKNIPGDGRAVTESAPFFGSQKYLTVSSQLHLEAFVHEHPRVWTSSPAFRAEKSDTPRHLSEFYMIEAELRTQSLDEVMECVENLIRHLAREMYGSTLYKELLSSRDGPNTVETPSTSRTVTIEQRWLGLRKSFWPRISYAEALKLLQSAAEEDDKNLPAVPAWGDGLNLEHEKFIAAEVGRGLPVFVTDYPRSVKPFYMLPSTNDSTQDSESPTAACFDLLLPDMCEVVGGSLREHRLPELLKSMQQHGLAGTGSEDVSAQSLDWYTDMRRYGSVPHGGFGLGIDRLVGYLAGVDNVKDVVTWPRYHGRCDG